MINKIKELECIIKILELRNKCFVLLLMALCVGLFNFSGRFAVLGLCAQAVLFVLVLLNLIKLRKYYKPCGPHCIRGNSSNTGTQSLDEDNDPKEFIKSITIGEGLTCDELPAEGTRNLSYLPSKRKV